MHYDLLDILHMHYDLLDIIHAMDRNMNQRKSTSSASSVSMWPFCSGPGAGRDARMAGTSSGGMESGNSTRNWMYMLPYNALIVVSSPDIKSR